MRKVVAYETRADEFPLFQKFARKFDLDIKYIDDVLTPETAMEAKGAEGVTILGNYPVGSGTFKALRDVGVKYIGLRTAGYNHIDQEAAKAYGIRFSNVAYSPYCVADFATMLILMCVRKAKQILNRVEAQDFSVEGIQGREMRNLTIGIIGAGRIGSIVAKNLSGFGCNLIAHDTVERDELRGILKYVSLDELLEESDVITIHTPLFESTYHMINQERIAKIRTVYASSIVPMVLKWIRMRSSQGLRRGKPALPGLMCWRMRKEFFIMTAARIFWPTASWPF